MSIKVVCPNGHALKVKDDLAGKMGLCPVCKARVQVPALRPQAISEDAILDLMGTAEVPARSAPEARESPAAAPGIARKDGQAPPMKTCTKCNQRISALIHICPYCHTYIAKLGDF
jgi:hypothetical protein